MALDGKAPPGLDRVLSDDARLSVDTECLADRIRAIFDRFDKDSTGSLNRIELHGAFKTLIPSFTPVQINDYYKELVKGRDGSPVSREEFCEWILKGGGAAASVYKALMKETSDVLATSVREVFARFHQSGDGKLDMRELWRVFKSLDGKLRLKDLAVLSQELDTGGDGSVSVKEFLHWLRNSGSARANALARAILKETGKAREARIRNAFQRYDATGDGVLDVAELASALKVLGSFSSDEIKRVSADLDRSGDGTVSYEEFSTWIRCGKGDGSVLKAKSILAPSDGDGMEAVFYNFCGPGSADMDGSNFRRLCKDCDILGSSLDGVTVDLIFSDTRVKDHSSRNIDFLQFEFALELLSEKKGVTLRQLRTQVLVQGAPKKLTKEAQRGEEPRCPSFSRSTASQIHLQLGSPQRKPKKSSSQKRVAALLKRSQEIPGEESWRRDVDNSKLWKVFGLHTAAGRNLKKLYQPPYVPHVRSSGSLGSLAPAGAKHGASCQENSWNSPFEQAVSRGFKDNPSRNGVRPSAPKLAW